MWRHAQGWDRVQSQPWPKRCSGSATVLKVVNWNGPACYFVLLDSLLDRDHAACAGCSWFLCDTDDEHLTNNHTFSSISTTTTTNTKHTLFAIQLSIPTGMAPHTSNTSRSTDDTTSRKLAVFTTSCIHTNSATTTFAISRHSHATLYALSTRDEQY